MVDLKQVVCSVIDKQVEDLSFLSKEIWDYFELNFNEVYSYDYLIKFLEDRGFFVDWKYKNEIVFWVVFGDYFFGFYVVVLCEYDVFLEIGYVCGYNFIVEVGVVVGIGIKVVFEKVGKLFGKVSICILFYIQVLVLLFFVEYFFGGGGGLLV